MFTAVLMLCACAAIGLIAHRLREFTYPVLILVILGFVAYSYVHG